MTDFREISEAVAAIERRGDRVSLRTVRAELGGGSFSSLAPLLASVRAQRAADGTVEQQQVPPMPDALRQAWVDAWRLAETQASGDRVSLLGRIATLTAERDDAREGLSALESDLADATARAGASEAKAREAVAEIERLRAQIVAAAAERQALRDELLAGVFSADRPRLIIEPGGYRRTRRKTP